MRGMSRRSFGRLAAGLSPVALTVLKPAASRPKERRDIPLMGQVYLN